MPLSRRLLWLTWLTLLALSWGQPGHADVIGDLLRRAESWQSRERTDLARKELQKLFRISPDNPDGLATLAFIAIQENRFEEATRTADRLAAISPQHPLLPPIRMAIRVLTTERARLQQARFAAKTGRTEEAVRLFSELYQGKPPTPDLALEYWRLVADTPNGWQPALQGLRRLVAEHPFNRRYRLALIEHRLARDPGNRRLLDRLKGFLTQPTFERAAAAIWRHALRRLDETPENLPLYRDYLAYDPKDEALAELVGRLERESNDPGYKALRAAKAALDRGDVAHGARALAQARRLHPEDPRVIGELGRLRLAQGRHEEAEAYFRRALRLDPDNTSKWRSLRDTAHYWGLLAKARAYMRDDRREAARAAIRKALRLRPNQPDALSLLAQWYRRRGDAEKAIHLFRRALGVEPGNASALGGLIGLQIDRGALARARRLVASLTPVQRRALGDDLPRLEAKLLRAESDVLLRDGHLREAVSKLQQAQRLRPRDPWLLYDLVRLYRRQGRPERGLELFARTLKQARGKDDDELHYAYGLLLESLDQVDAAVTQLRSIPRTRRTANMQDTLERLLVRQGRQRALAARDAGRPEEASAILEDLQSRLHDRPKRLLELARGWREIGRPERGLALLRTLHRGEAGAEIAPLRARLLMDMAGHLREQGKEQAAGKLLEEIPPRVFADPDLLRTRAQLLSRMGRVEAALKDYEALYHRSHHALDPGFDLVHAQLAAGHGAQARVLAMGLSRRLDPTDLTHRRDLIRIWQRLGEPERARAAMASLLRDFPEDPQVLTLAAERAEESDEKDEALELYRTARDQYRNAGPEPLAETPPRLLDLEERITRLSVERSAGFDTAYDLITRAATAGKSTKTLQRIPMTLRWPAPFDGHLFGRIEPISLDADSLEMGDRIAVSEFGQGLFCYPSCNGAPAHQRASGTAFGIGYENDRLRVDLGTTPSTFPVHYVLGGIEIGGDLGDFYWSLDLSRRPMTSTLLSFSGTRDIATGRTWGGVRKTGATLSFGHDLGGDWGFWSNLQYHELTGRNLANNTRMRLMGGLYRRLVRREDFNLRVGLNAQLWTHARSLGEFTFGHGGYYSPTRYRSLSLPIHVFGHIDERLSYLLSGSVSHSWTYVERSPFYPNDPELQRAAEAASGSTGIDPYYSGGKGGGLGYKAVAAIEYKVNDHLSIGLWGDVEEGDYYKPYHFQVYLRYLFEKDPREVRSPPESVDLYTEF